MVVLTVLVATMVAVVIIVGADRDGRKQSEGRYAKETFERHVDSPFTGENRDGLGFRGN